MVLRGHGKALIGVQFTVTAPDRLILELFGINKSLTEMLVFLLFKKGRLK